MIHRYLQPDVAFVFLNRGARLFGVAQYLNLDLLNFRKHFGHTEPHAAAGGIFLTFEIVSGANFAMLRTLFVIILSMLFVFTVAGIALSDGDFAGLGLASKFLIKNDQLVEFIVDELHSGVTLLFLRIALCFMFKAHHPFRGRAKFDDNFLPFDNDVDFRDTVHMAFGMALLSGKATDANNKKVPDIEIEILFRSIGRS